MAKVELNLLLLICLSIFSDASIWGQRFQVSSNHKAFLLTPILAFNIYYRSFNEFTKLQAFVTRMQAFVTTLQVFATKLQVFVTILKA